MALALPARRIRPIVTKAECTDRRRVKIMRKPNPESRKISKRAIERQSPREAKPRTRRRPGILPYLSAHFNRPNERTAKFLRQPFGGRTLLARRFGPFFRSTHGGIS